MNIRTVHICDRGDRGLCPVAYSSKADAEAYGREQQPAGETWPVVAFVGLDSLYEAICRACHDSPDVGRSDHACAVALTAISKAVSDESFM